MPFLFFPLPKVPCDATTTCNGHGTCTNHGDCQCDNGFYAANCSGKFSFNHSIIKIYFEILNALLEQLSAMLQKNALIMAPVVMMGNVYAMMDTMEATAQVN